METVSITLFYDAAVFAIYLFSLIGKGLCLAYFLQEFLKHKHFSRGFASFLTILIYVSFCLASRQGSGNDDAHGIIDIGFLHDFGIFCFDDILVCFCSHVSTLNLFSPAPLFIYPAGHH